MKDLINGCFENKEAYARFNYLIDLIRENVPGNYSWKELSKDTKKMYLEEADVAEYVITLDDIKEIENCLFTPH